MVAGNQVLPGAPAAPDQDDGFRARRGGGSGGRWLIWPLRIVVWAVVLLIGYRGVAAIITGPGPAARSASQPARHAGRGFPVTLAQAYALQFGQAYLNFSPATAGQRARSLAAFLPPGTDAQLGWNGAGTEVLQSEQVASVAVRDAHRAVITLLARVNGRMVELGVPVYAAGRALAVTGEPALLPPPGRASPPQAPPPAADQATESALSSQLPAFFQAYASGDKVTLGRFLAAGARVTGLAGGVTFSSLAQLAVPPGGAVRHITVTVTWQLPAPAGSQAAPVTVGPAQLQMTYAMTVVRQNGSWYVQSIGASPAQPGPP